MPTRNHDKISRRAPSLQSGGVQLRRLGELAVPLEEQGQVGHGVRRARVVVPHRHLEAVQRCSQASLRPLRLAAEQALHRGQPAPGQLQVRVVVGQDLARGRGGAAGRDGWGVRRMSAKASGGSAEQRKIGKRHSQDRSRLEQQLSLFLLLGEVHDCGYLGRACNGQQPANRASKATKAKATAADTLIN